MTDSELNTKVLDRLIKSFGGKLPVAQVGIIGDHNSRSSKDGQSNAEIGARHEFGSAGMPMRSFLRMPIINMMQRYLNKGGFFTPDSLKKVLQEGKIVEWVAKIGVVAEAIVLDGFGSGGFGLWKPSNMKYKKNKQTLVETQQLRNSITSRVKEE